MPLLRRRSAMGMFFDSFAMRGRFRKVLDNWPSHNVQIIVVSDGSRILGLGDLGARLLRVPVWHQLPGLGVWVKFQVWDFNPFWVGACWAAGCPAFHSQSPQQKVLPAARGPKWQVSHHRTGASCAARQARSHAHGPLAGVNGMGIPLGKIQLYVAGGGFHPEHSLPAIIDNGTNTKSNIEDKFYFVGAPASVPLPAMSLNLGMDACLDLHMPWLKTVLLHVQPKLRHELVYSMLPASARCCHCHEETS